MKTLGIFLLSLLLGLSTTFGQTILAGKVLSKNDGQPVSGATISIKGDTSVSVITNAGGAFKFTVPASAKVLLIKAPGFLSKAEGIGQKTVFTIELSADPAVSKEKKPESTANSAQKNQEQSQMKSPSPSNIKESKGQNVLKKSHVNNPEHHSEKPPDPDDSEKE